jgi:RNA polymerase sigma-70 factor (ECF subfamily)
MIRWKRRTRGRACEVENRLAETVDRLYATALRLTRSEADAEDLVQETFSRALEAGPRLDPAVNLKAYLYRTLMNLFINQYRHCRIVRHVDDLAEVGLLDGSLYSSDCVAVWSNPHARFLHAHLSADVETALDALPERFRTVMVMVDLMDFSYGEVAEQLGIPVGTVMSRLFRARQFMRERLAGREDCPVRLPVRRAARR